MANKHMKKKCSASLAKKEMQIKSTLRFHLSSVKIALTKKTQQQMVAKMQSSEPLCTAGETIN